jgi:FkbM family methyltransferase
MLADRSSLDALRARLTSRGQAFIRDRLRRRGLALVGYTPEDYVHLRRVRVLAAHGVDLVLDVGANTGQYVGNLRMEGYAGRIVSFEPASASFAALSEAAASDPDWQVRQWAIGDVAGTLELHTYADSRHNSTLAPAPGRPMQASLGVETAPVKVLDDLEGEIWTEADRIALKLDVEGFEGEALSGAAALLDHTVVVEVELSTVALHAGQALLPEIASRLYERGFRLTSLRPIWTDPASGALIQADGIFERSPESAAGGDDARRVADGAGARRHVDQDHAHGADLRAAADPNAA